MSLDVSFAQESSGLFSFHFALSNFKLSKKRTLPIVFKKGYMD